MVRTSPAPPSPTAPRSPTAQRTTSAGAARRPHYPRRGPRPPAPRAALTTPRRGPRPPAPRAALTTPAADRARRPRAPPSLPPPRTAPAGPARRPHYPRRGPRPPAPRITGCPNSNGPSADSTPAAARVWPKGRYTCAFATLEPGLAPSVELGRCSRPALTRPLASHAPFASHASRATPTRRIPPNSTPLGLGRDGAAPRGCVRGAARSRGSNHPAPRRPRARAQGGSSRRAARMHPLQPSATSPSIRRRCPARRPGPARLVGALVETC
jgi:hypothetical protein